MNKIKNIIKTFVLWELLKGLSVTLRNFFKPKATIQYPEEKHHNHQDFEVCTHSEDILMEKKDK